MIEKSRKNEFNEDIGREREEEGERERERERERDSSSKRAKTPLGRKKSLGEEGNNINNNINHNKFVNRNDDNTFVNEKMKIRPDPNKSIFKTSPNSAFFNQAKNNNNDIIVMAKGDPKKYDYNINKDEARKESTSPPSSNKKKYLNSTQPIFENKPKKPLLNNFENESKTENYNNKTINKFTGNRFENEDENNNTEYNNTNDDNVRTKYNRNKDRKIINKKKEDNFRNNNKNREINDNNNSLRPVAKNTNNKVDSILINKLLSQMNSLSAKQLSLIDAMGNIQTDAQQQIKSLNDKIFSLDSIVDELTSELNELRSQNI